MEPIPAPSPVAQDGGTAILAPRRVRLPEDILNLIINAVVPANAPIMIPTSNLVAQTLLALSRVSHETRPLASQLLRQRCMYIDSKRRLIDVLSCMELSVPTLPPIMRMQHTTSIYLAPFSDLVDEVDTAEIISKLCHEVGRNLRRLVVQIPCQSLEDYCDVNDTVVKTVLEGFQQLDGLEEFVCLEGYPLLDLGPGPRWPAKKQMWPKLERVLFTNVEMSCCDLWPEIAARPKLQDVVFACSLNVTNVTNVKEDYFGSLSPEDPRLQREIRVVLMEEPLLLFDPDTDGWEEIDPEQRMNVFLHAIPRHREGDHEFVKAWMRRKVLDGSIWRSGDLFEMDDSADETDDSDE